MTLCDYEVRPLLAPIFENGEMVYTLPTLSEISEYAKREMETFWDEYKRLHSPHRYKVDLSSPFMSSSAACSKSGAARLDDGNQTHQRSTQSRARQPGSFHRRNPL